MLVDSRGVPGGEEVTASPPGVTSSSQGVQVYPCSWINPPAWQRHVGSWHTALLSPQRHDQDGLGHPQISLLFHPPECIASAQAGNPLCPVLGATSRGSGQLCSGRGAGSAGDKPLPTAPSTSCCTLARPASSIPSAAPLCSSHLISPRLEKTTFQPSSADLPSPAGFRATPRLL